MHVLTKLESIKQDKVKDFSRKTLFTIDVKALYPSVNLNHLKTALRVCFTESTEWTKAQIDILIDLIVYTLENQQILWDGKLFRLNKGIPTGAKHSVPLANIFLSFIFKDLLSYDRKFTSIFKTNVNLWTRFIDDCFGIFGGSETILNAFFEKLQAQYRKYDLELTSDIQQQANF